MLSGSLSPRHDASYVADGGDGLQIFRVAASILNDQLRRDQKCWHHILKYGRGVINTSSKTSEY